MKFVCEQCKAKYQLSDDKVAGKTIRMNCRKCGHPIQIKVPAQPSQSAPPPCSIGDNSPTRIGEVSEAIVEAMRMSLLDIGPASAQAPSVREEWFVGINGDPSGPFTREQITTKMRAGTITSDSLAWHEGLDDWRPVADILELAELRKSLALSIPVPAPPVPAAPPPSRPSRPGPPPPPSRPSRPGPPRPAPSRPAPLHSPPLIEGESPLDVVPDPFAGPPAPATTPDLPAPAHTAPMLPDVSGPVSSQRGAPTPVAAVAVMRTSESPPKKKPTWLPYAVTFMLGSFCTALDLAIIKPPAPVGPAASAPASPTQPPVAGTVQSTSLTIAAETATPRASGSVVALPPSTPPSTATSTAIVAAAPAATLAATETAPTIATGGGLDLSGLRTSGPRPDLDPQGTGGGKATAGGCYAQSDIQRVIGTRQGGVRRLCWTNATTSSTSVGVNVSMTIGPQGNVESVAATGDDASVARCVEGDVRRWTFAAGGCSQRTTFSLKFIRQ